MKVPLFSLLTIPMLGICGGEISYTQNNLAHQNSQAGFDKNYPIIVNADLLYGEIKVQSQSFVSIPENNTTAPIKSNPGYGFRLGLGVGLNNQLNVSVQYSWLRNKKNPYTENFTAVGTSFFGTAPFLNNLTTQTSQKIRWQQADLIVQTAAWMLSSYLRFQPFGGMRLVKFQRNLNITGESDVFVILGGPGTIPIAITDKIRGLGGFIGTDIKYLINDAVHFFSSISAGVVAGKYTNLTHFEVLIPTVPNPIFIADNQYSHEMNWLPSMDMIFGFAVETMLGKGFLFSLRVAYEISSLYQKSAPVYVVAPNIGQDQNVYLVQMGSVGFTLAF